ncbi:MAG: Rho termination factor N-terminal domain-containing protein [Candidatus Marinimicrobia bacterium]|nr:Rho termination factor N-terminal domain-containing protein [Candidatus Neomarinimicrobiota bacterium]
MDYKFKDLKHMTIAELREIASKIEHEAVKGYTQLNKEHLLAAICKALNIDMYVHHDVVGVNKNKIKLRIRELKKVRDEALSAHDHIKLRRIRRQIHRYKRILRKATV